MTRQLSAEFIGTFIMVLCGTGAIVIGWNHIWISAAFGLSVTGMIYLFGSTSGAHINPAVTIAFWLSGRFPGNDVLPYSIVQILGGLSASLLLLVVYPDIGNYGMTLPNGSVIGNALFEIFLTFILMFVIIYMSTGSKEVGVWTGAGVGLAVFLAAYLGGPISGASMNPARSIGPAIASGNLTALWIYLIAPPVGAGLAILSCRHTKSSDCCPMPLVCK